MKKVCQRCHEEQDETAFSFDRTPANPHRRDTTCKHCHNAENQAWRDRNKPAYNRRVKERRKERGESYYAQKRTWTRTNKDRINAREREKRATNPAQHIARNQRWRARKKGATISDLSAAQWKEIKETSRHRCVYCGRKMQRLTQDHILPLSRGGNHTLSNVVPACQSCNSRKYTGSPLRPIQPLLLTVATTKKKRR